MESERGRVESRRTVCMYLESTIQKFMVWLRVFYNSSTEQEQASSKQQEQAASSVAQCSLLCR